MGNYCMDTDNSVGHPKAGWDNHLGLVMGIFTSVGDMGNIDGR